jgi:DNA (cytosine-5)-methyltransferase 1
MGVRGGRLGESAAGSDSASRTEYALSRDRARQADPSIHAKIERLSRGHAPRVLELCSGCGGLSLGLKAAGFDLVAHVESDPFAAQTYALNLGPATEHSPQWALARDMTKFSPKQLTKEFGLTGAPASNFDVLAAGLPCQAFARIGRSKLRSIDGDEHAFKKDARASLYKRFLDYVREVHPLVVLIENVPDILNFGGHNVPEEISNTLEGLGYRSAYTLLNTAFYGVPQMRERLILVAIHEALGVDPVFPRPTHKIELPRGYEGSRTVALKHVPESGSHFVSSPRARGRQRRAVSSREALADLPVIYEHVVEPETMQRRRVQDEIPYRKVKKRSAYARRMRGWRGFGRRQKSDGHVVRLTLRDFAIFRRMPPGSDYPTAVRIAETIFRERLRGRRRSHAVTPRMCEYRDLWQVTVPPYDPGKFPNKWWKLVPSQPSRTLTAHLGKDTYSHIHYDARQARTITVREAARLQSFPDGFRFAGQMNAAFRQIGNAVPPLLAVAIGRALRKTLLAAVAARARNRTAA